MGRTRTIAKQILDEAKQRVITAEADVNAAVIELEKAQAVLSSCRVGYAALQKSLAPQPRQSAGTTKVVSKPDEKRCAYKFSDLNEKECGGFLDAPIHDSDYGSERYHEFQPPAKPKKKSSPKKRAGLPVDRVKENERCRHVFHDGTACLGLCDQNIHQLRGVTNYHPFQPQADAQDAAQSSSTNGAGAFTTANSEAVAASAQSAVGGSSE